jgi:hypothetical protein
MDSIDEDENEQFLSPERLEFKSERIETSSRPLLASNTKLKQESTGGGLADTGNVEELRCDNTDSNNSNNELFADRGGEAKKIMNSDGVSVDSEEDDLKFLKQ